MENIMQALNLQSILPSSVAGDALMQGVAAAVQPALDGVQVNIIKAELLSRIDELPENVLRMLAWENRVDGVEWTLATTVEDKRELVKGSFELNQRRGTRWGVERIFTLLRFVPDITEWYEDGGVPGTWRVSFLDVGQRGVSGLELASVFTLVEQYRPVSRHLVGLNIGASPLPSQVFCAAAVQLSALVVCSPAPALGLIEPRGTVHAAVAVSVQSMSVDVLPGAYGGIARTTVAGQAQALARVHVTVRAKT